MINSAKSRSRLRHHLQEFQDYKEELGCQDCKQKFPHYVLEFDHRPEYDKIDIVYRVLRNYGPDAAWAEVKKCDVVCANCHKQRTYIREIVKVEHKNKQAS